MSDQTTRVPADAEQPDGIADDSCGLPDKARAAGRVNEFLSWFGDGRVYLDDPHPALFARDLQALSNAALADAVKLGDVEALQTLLDQTVHAEMTARQQLNEIREAVDAVTCADLLLMSDAIGKIRSIFDRPAAAPARSGRCSKCGEQVHHDDQVAHARMHAAAPAEPREEQVPRCTCFVTPESEWTTHYGAVEPGSTMEQNPDCPVHPAAAPAEHPETLAARELGTSEVWSKVADDEYTWNTKFAGSFEPRSKSDGGTVAAPRTLLGWTVPDHVDAYPNGSVICRHASHDGINPGRVVNPRDPEESSVVKHFLLDHSHGARISSALGAHGSVVEHQPAQDREQ